MSRTNLIWLLLLVGAVAFLLWSIFTLPQAEPIAEAISTPTVAPTATYTPIPTGQPICETNIPTEGGVVVFGMVGAPQYPNPLLADDNPVDRMLVDLLFDGLVRFDRHGLAQPALAETWHVSEDGLTVTFVLREEARWHDGQPVTARDVAFTYGLLASDATHPDNMLWQSAEINPINDKTIAFTLPQPYSPIFEALSRGILPSHVFAENITLADLRNNIFNNQPIGTGAFLAANDWVEEGYMRLLPVGTAWVNVGIDAVDMRFFADDMARADAYATNEIDGIIGVTREMVPMVLALDGMRLFTSPQTRYAQLIFNMSAGNTQNQSVRDGITLATNKSAVIQLALNAQGLPLSGAYTSESWAAGSTTTDRFDGVAAIARLEEAGWLFSEEGMDVRERTNDSGTEALDVRLLVIDSAENRRIADILLAQWAEVGIGGSLIALEPTNYYTALQEGDFDVALVTVDPLNDPDLYDFWSQEAIFDGQNFGRWNNRIASEALEEARQIWEPEARFQHYETFNRAFAADRPALSLFQYVQSFGIGEWVLSAEDSRPVPIAFINQPRDFFSTLPEWRIETETINVICEN